MILYFSGTGNSRYAAELIAKVTGDTAQSLFDALRGGRPGRYESDRPYVFVTPTYGWRIPRLVEDHLRASAFSGSRAAYFVMTCGGGIGAAGRWNARLCDALGLEYRGTAGIVMPENYLAMFPVPDARRAAAILRRARPEICRAAEHIAREEPLPKVGVTPVGLLNSAAVNPFFRKYLVHARLFYATPACVGCGTCVRLCPTGNVRLEAGRPVWGDACVHCMACIGACPARAIEYGKRTRTRNRYYNTETPEIPTGEGPSHGAF